VEICYDSEDVVKRGTYIGGRERERERERWDEMRKVAGTERREKLYILVEHLPHFSVLFLQNSRHQLACPEYGVTT
jgi:hypothetical protein